MGLETARLDLELHLCLRRGQAGQGWTRVSTGKSMDMTTLFAEVLYMQHSKGEC